MAKSTPNKPTAPNYRKLATEQGALNKDVADDVTLANRPNQVGLGGSLTWKQDPKTGAWTQTVTRDATNQGQYNTLTNLQKAALGEMDVGPIDTSGMADWGDPSKLGAGFGNVKEVQDAMMGILQPGLDRSRAAEIQRLKAQGLTEGSDAWNASLQNLGNIQNDASLKALLAGTTEYGNIFNRQLAANKYSDALRGLQYGEATSQHNLPFSDYQNLSTAKTGLDPRFQNFMGAESYQAPNVMGAEQERYSDDISRYNADLAAKVAQETGYMDMFKASKPLWGPFAEEGGEAFKEWVKSWFSED